MVIVLYPALVLGSLMICLFFTNAAALQIFTSCVSVFTSFHVNAISSPLLSPEYTASIHDFSRLARSTKDLLEIVERLQSKGIHLISNKENIDTSTPTGKLMLTLIGAIAEFERQNLLDRQREGIAIAKREGRYKGGKKKYIPNFRYHYDRYMRRETTKAALARELHISRPTLDRLITDYLNS